MSNLDKYEAIIGLEIHAQLLTESKAYSSDSAAYGGAPNTHVSVISLGHPGTLPRMNEKVINYAIKAGLALNCTINHYNEFSRKNYFYADMPKGYQISQFDTPICSEGYIDLKMEEGIKRINITRIHMEEDSGKGLHDQDPYNTLIDLNRAGVPLIEIVTEPDFRSAKETYTFLTEIRKIVRYLNICDGNMEEGSMRCDANVSIREKGSEQLGNKVEVKNMNSLRNVQKAIQYEIKRQIEATEKGERIDQDTMGFDVLKGVTFSMRSKEMVHDYRYFPEPDLPPITLTDDYINAVKEEMPALPEALSKQFRDEYALSDYDAAVLTDTKEIALYFNQLAEKIKSQKEDKKLYKSAANWISGPVKSYLNDKALKIDQFPVSIDTLLELILLVDSGKISFSIASQRLFGELIKGHDSSVEQLAEKLGLLHESDDSTLLEFINEAIAAYPDKVKDYRSGNKNLLGLFMGEVMKRSKGKADPKATNQLLIKTLNNAD